VYRKKQTNNKITKLYKENKNTLIGSPQTIVTTAIVIFDAIVAVLSASSINYDP